MLSRHLPVAGAVLFGLSLVVLGWWWVTLPGREPRWSAWSAIAVNAALFSAFALHHSVLARRSIKARAEQIVGTQLVRPLYVALASLLLAGMCVVWTPIGGTVYAARGDGALVLRAVQLLGLAVGFGAVRRIDVRELAGLVRPAAHDTALQQTGPYRLVRHPLYLAWVLIVWGTPTMSGDRLLFAVLSSMYLLVAVPFEEADLRRQFGSRYLEYQRTVRWRLIPYLH